MAGSILTFMLMLFALSVPVAVAITAVFIGSVTLFGDAPLLVVAQKLVTSIDSFPLMAVPFFILSGNLMESGGISVRLVDFAKSIVGNIQGGLACFCVLTCIILAAVAGSSVATHFCYRCHHHSYHGGSRQSPPDRSPPYRRQQPSRVWWCRHRFRSSFTASPQRFPSLTCSSPGLDRACSSPQP